MWILNYVFVYHLQRREFNSFINNFKRYLSHLSNNLIPPKSDLRRFVLLRHETTMKFLFPSTP